MSDKRILSTKRVIIVTALIFLFTAIFYFAAYEELNYSFEEISEETNSHISQSLIDGTKIQEEIDLGADYLRNIQLQIGTYGRKNDGVLILSIYDGDRLLKTKKFKASKIEDNSFIQLDVDKKIDSTLTFVVEAYGAENDSAVALYYSDFNGMRHKFNGETIDGGLSIKLTRGNPSRFTIYYKVALLAIVIGLIAIVIRSMIREQNGKNDTLVNLCVQFNRYYFLIKQLVQRDYKAKYMRSVLGLLWSLLYPVLMMGVQYVVFSTLFRTNIRYYPVYLLCANAMFTFFSNSVGSGLTSIVNNASLITKVYVPKYLYPVTKILSTSIDLFLAMIPLTIVVLLTGAPITKAWLLIPLAFILLMFFSAGMAFMLSTLNVFFRDTQFLWGLATTVWMYATPLFYPETAIPEQFRFLFNLNPMYHYISFFRRILMYGYSPTVPQLLVCIGFSIGVYIIGMRVFKKHEGKFILFI